ncbi:MAG: ATP-grasp domain-containing protein [Chloroflexi bacterium]|nr:ATP-grasp domain-containing protein [Chloroflexota bacterium]
MTKILVTGAGALLGQGIIKSLRLAPTPYHIVAADPDPRAVGLYWSDTAYLLPLATAPDYFITVCRILEREKPDAVLIGTDVELMIFARHKETLESNYNARIVVSSPDVIRIADDKWLTYLFLKEHGFPFPHSALPDDLETLFHHCDFPLVVKPRSGARSVGVRVVNNKHELQTALVEAHEPVIQEYVATPHDEYTTGVLVSEGQAQAVVTMRRDLRDGNTYRAYVETASPFDDVLSKIAVTLGGVGPINLQFRVADGVPKVFEINARFSGTTPLRAYAGFNEVDWVLRHFLRGESIPCPVLRPVTILRYWDEIVIASDQLNMATSVGQLSQLSFERPTQL